jgi:hypothetical protein
MNEDLQYLIERCRESAPDLTNHDVLAKCRAAAEQKGNGRVRTIAHSRKKKSNPELGSGGRGVKWSDLQAALLTATDALWQEDHGTWKIIGGTDLDGDPLILAVVVDRQGDDVYVWTTFAP